MRALIIVMLVVQALMFIVAACTVLIGRPAAGRERPVWSSLAISLIIVAGTSWQIADKHEGGEGADVLAYGSPLLLGMGLMAAFMAIRQRRGLDGGS